MQKPRGRLIIILNFSVRTPPLEGRAVYSPEEVGIQKLVVVRFWRSVPEMHETNMVDNLDFRACFFKEFALQSLLMRLAFLQPTTWDDMGPVGVIHDQHAVLVEHDCSHGGH